MCIARSTKYCTCHETLRQASKQVRAAHLWIWCAAGRGAAPPPTPPKSALHRRHPRLPRNQYFKVNSPVPNFSNQANMPPLSLYLSIYLPIYVFIDPFLFLSVYLQFNIHKVLHLPRNLHFKVHKVLRLPPNLHSKAHKVLHLPPTLHFHIKKSCDCHEICTPRPIKSCAYHWPPALHFNMCIARSTKYCTCHETLRQASKQVRAAHLWIWCAAGRGAAPPPTPPKSALHRRHPRLPRNQYFKVNSPVPNFSNQANMPPLSLYLSIYLPIYVFIDPFLFLSVYLQFNIHKVLHLPRNLHFKVHKVLRLPPNLHSKAHKVLHLPPTLHFHIKNSCACHEICTPRPQSPAPATKSAQGHKVLRLARNLHSKAHKSKAHKVLRLPPATNSALQHPQSPAPATKCALQGPQSTAPATKHYDYHYDTAAIVRLLLLLLLLFGICFFLTH